jgi:hypothetical protein
VELDAATDAAVGAGGIDSADGAEVGAQRAFFGENHGYGDYRRELSGSRFQIRSGVPEHLGLKAGA